MSEHHLNVGDAVVKVNGYPFPGEVRAVFQTVAGKVRIVVESRDLPGLLHIFDAKQIEAVP